MTATRPKLLLCSLAVLAAAAGAWASPPSPLPAFELAPLEGAAVPVASLVPEGRWLLAYLSPHSGASAPLLRALEGAEGGPRLLVVVGADAAAAKAMAASFEGRLQASWYADPDGSARRALGLAGVPAVLGLRDGSIQWTLTGAVSDHRTLRSILVSWR